MEPHLKFLPGGQRVFLQEVKIKSGLSSNRLSLLTRYCAREFRDWCREKYTLPKSVALHLSDLFNVDLPEAESDLESRWRRMKSGLGVSGGLACFLKHGNPATPEGRIKGGLRALEVARSKGLIPPPKAFRLPHSYSGELSEFVGILLGDGGLTRFQCKITLNREADNDYIDFVRGLTEKLFGDRGYIYSDKDSKADNIVFSGVNLINYFVSIGLETGNKVRQQVGVPKWILGNSMYEKACLRGLMDTDGGLFVHRYAVGGKTYSYTKISFANHSYPLVEFVSQTLLKLGFPAVVTDYDKKYRVWIYDQGEAQRYFKVVGSSNQRLIRHLDG